MKKNKKRFTVTYVNILLILLLYILRASGLLLLKIGDISPILLLPLVVSISLFFGEWNGAAAGFLVGLLMDTTTLGSSVFSCLCFMLIGLTCGVAANFYLNKNIKSALALSVCASFAYYLFKFLFLSIIAGTGIDGQYFASFVLPSIAYTSIFIIPFYFLQKKLKEL
ncbi:MAG: rod shape-determining protein MreD [Clostridia bacterium]|nr:rod shape-determining protein MreD [Clostridia bacterium]